MVLMNNNNNLSRAGWVLVVRRPELSFETYEFKVKEVIFLDPSVTITDIETIVKYIKEKDKAGIKMEFQLVPLVQATSQELEEYLEKIVSGYNTANPIDANEFTLTAGEIIPL